MPQLIPMVALVAFDRNGKHLSAGDTFDAYPIEAASLKYNHKASFAAGAARPVQTRSLTPGARPSRQAPPPQQRVAEATEQADGSDGRRTTSRGGRGGGYQRRDMAAPEDKG